MERVLRLSVLAFGSLAVCIGEINVRFDIRSWTEARDTCRKQVNFRSCDLITETTLQKEWKTLGLSGSDNYWVGARRLYRWIWDDVPPTTGANGGEVRLYKDDGCYKWAVDEADLGSALKANGPDKCLATCDGAFVYLRGDYCVCSETLRGEEVPRENCPQPCDGSDVKCGGNVNYFSVYSLPQKVEFSDNRDSRMCAAAQLRNGVLKIESTDCTSSRQYFCLSDLQASQIDSRSVPFDTAVSRCRDQHSSSMPSLSSHADWEQYLSTLRTLTNTLSSSFFTTFWLPLRRHVGTVWVDGKRGEQGGELDNCIAIDTDTRAGVYRQIDLPCSTSHPAICECAKSEDGGNGNNDGKDEKPGPSKVIIAVIAVFMVLLVGSVVVVIIIKRRQYASIRKIERELIQQRLAGGNPLYKGSGNQNFENPSLQGQTE